MNRAQARPRAVGADARGGEVAFACGGGRRAPRVRIPAHVSRVVRVAGLRLAARRPHWRVAISSRDRRCIGLTFCLRDCRITQASIGAASHVVETRCTWIGDVNVAYAALLACTGAGTHSLRVRDRVVACACKRARPQRRWRWIGGRRSGWRRRWRQGGRRRRGRRRGRWRRWNGKRESAARRVRPVRIKRRRLCGR